jgi:signal transduction histidine kinase
MAGARSSPDRRQSLLIRSILDKVKLQLAQRGSGLTSGEVLDPLFARNTASILREVLDSFPLEANQARDLVSVEYGSGEGLNYTGRARASQSRHPAESLMAAEILFGVALPELVPYLVAVSDKPVDTIDIAQTLHHAVWRRFPPGAIAYVEYILEQLSSAKLENRKQISRELHDRVAHGIAAGLQRIDLSRIRGDDTSQAQDDLDSAVTILENALADTQDIAIALRHLIGKKSLDEAIRDYLTDLGLSELVETTVYVSGSPGRLISSIAEDAFAIVIEAIRNAARHAGATQIDVNLTWEAGNLTIAIVDNGRGFDVSDVRSGSIGLSSMQERAHLINARIGIKSDSNGTTIALTLPLTISAHA